MLSALISGPPPPLLASSDENCCRHVIWLYVGVMSTESRKRKALTS